MKVVNVVVELNVPDDTVLRELIDAVEFELRRVAEQAVAAPLQDAIVYTAYPLHGNRYSG